ncbi:hypothetical protein niasHT_022267 [Heterodera trifolii]|uniref:NR LBD domain-containing protein n=1 Tax=Heterodera trifolii TaxID=157864 RepID=A0ABD2KBD5_9BILA
MNSPEGNEMEKRAIKKGEKRRYKKNPKIAKECIVCGRATLFKYYKTQSCDATKSCRACRFDKCLLEGMDPTMVEAEQSPALSQFIQTLYKRREFLRQGKMSEKQCDDDMDTESINENENGTSADEQNGVPTFCEPLADPIQEKWRFKRMLLRLTIAPMNSVEQKIRSFIGMRHEFDDGFFGQFSTLKEFLQGAENIVFNPTKYTKAREHAQPEHIYKNAAKHGNFSAKNPLLLSEIVSVIDLFRTMPHFPMLEPNDQAILLSFIAVPLIDVNARFYSSKINSQIVTVLPNNSFSPLYLYHNNPFYAGDKTIQTLSDSLYVKSMRLFNKLRLLDEEFLLVRALISSHSAVTGLSAAGRLTLQQLSEHYADLLMHHLRTNHGNMAGALRYAELIHLIESVFSTAKRHREFFTYLAMVTDQGRFHATIPHIFMPMILHGTTEK